MYRYENSQHFNLFYFGMDINENSCNKYYECVDNE